MSEQWSLQEQGKGQTSSGRTSYGGASITETEPPFVTTAPKMGPNNGICALLAAIFIRFVGVDPDLRVHVEPA
jgi:hypothetical protein